MKILCPAILFGLSACAGAARPGEHSPFATVTAEYAVPIALAKVFPGTVGGWEDGSISLDRWLRGWTARPAAHDVDNALVNYGLHPLAGSETHLIARKHGWSFGEAFLFDVACSVSWEYVFENLYEPPSRIDLLVTAPAGALLGELRWLALEAGAPAWLVDPLGGRGRPFVELDRDGFLVGLERRF
jgi:hypothetical protein